MKKQPKKLILRKETLRDLAVHNAGEVKGGQATRNCTHKGDGCTFYKVA